MKGTIYHFYTIQMFVQIHHSNVRTIDILRTRTLKKSMSPEKSLLLLELNLNSRTSLPTQYITTTLLVTGL